MNDMRNNLEPENHIEMLSQENHYDDSDQLSFDDIPVRPSSLLEEFGQSLTLIKSSKLNLLLVFAPISFLGSQTGKLGEFPCFCFAGLALIPCAER